MALTPSLPAEIWNKIALSEPRVYNSLVRAMPCIKAEEARELFCDTRDSFTFEFKISQEPSIGINMFYMGDSLHTDGVFQSSYGKLGDKLYASISANVSYGGLAWHDGTTPSLHYRSNAVEVEVYAKKGRVFHDDYRKPVIIVRDKTYIAYIWARDGLATRISITDSQSTIMIKIDLLENTIEYQHIYRNNYTRTHTTPAVRRDWGPDLAYVRTAIEKCAEDIRESGDRLVAIFVALAIVVNRVKRGHYD